MCGSEGKGGGGEVWEDKGREDEGKCECEGEGEGKIGKVREGEGKCMWV